MGNASKLQALAQFLAVMIDTVGTDVQKEIMNDYMDREGFNPDFRYAILWPTFHEITEALKEQQEK